jgi:hypothetical protein
MRKFLALGAIAALSFGTQSAVADGFSYNLAEGSYISGDGYDGFGVAGSLELHPNFFGLASVDTLSADGGGPDVMLLGVGAGYNRSLNKLLDLVATASLKYADVDGGGSDTGIGLGIGLRGRLLEQLELHGGLEYVDIGGGSDTTLQIGARYYVTPNFGAGLDLLDNDGGSTLRFALRYDFGNRL